jgi:hypothetical protein
MLLCRLSGAQGAAVMSFPPLLNKYRALGFAWPSSEAKSLPICVAVPGSREFGNRFPVAVASGKPSGTW